MEANSDLFVFNLLGVVGFLIGVVILIIAIKLDKPKK